jgi:hypothetical protein
MKESGNRVFAFRLIVGQDGQSISLEREPLTLSAGSAGQGRPAIFQRRSAGKWRKAETAFSLSV